jgi:hypothetical protein
LTRCGSVCGHSSRRKIGQERSVVDRDRTSKTGSEVDLTTQVECVTCGRVHPLDESELTFKLPDEVFGLSEEDRLQRCQMNADIVHLDGQRYFLRGVLPLKVAGRRQPYNIGTWAEVSPDVFGRIYDRWDDADQDQEPRLPGVLANAVPFHPSAVQLRVGIQLTGPKSRPEFHLEPIEHSLYDEQARGIDEHRALEYSDPEARRAAAKHALPNKQPDR